MNGHQQAAGRSGRRRIRVLLADDQTLVRAGFRVLLEDTEDLEVIGEAANGAEAVDLARSTRPDVVLMDVRMPVMDGLEATRRILGDPLRDRRHGDCGGPAGDGPGPALGHPRPKLAAIPCSVCS